MLKTKPFNYDPVPALKAKKCSPYCSNCSEFLNNRTYISIG
ncbi:hypothetical protein QWZ13_02825 [Reinekea marina]|nr:hypothetical protein [Reinekea marina]MDN3647844.1 hypothetical protein [Reinekea marina]